MEGLIDGMTSVMICFLNERVKGYGMDGYSIQLVRYCQVNEQGDVVDTEWPMTFDQQFGC